MPTKSSGNASLGSPPVYRSKPLQPHRDDSYEMAAKPTEPAVCRECGAVFHAGRWQWKAKSAHAHAVLCPACHRIQDAMPAGYLTLQGAFVAQHRDDLRQLMRNVEAKEKADHPLQRIIEINEAGDTIDVTTTDAHLVRSLGEAVHRAYQGRIDFKYGEDENFVRAHWTR